ncbi:hypothetical protein AVEN_146319-1 [Araneus ventricosus]|uniref:Uncharacterized protein n=1 Tax=Araneus ventricosus TaxID=182803 RepID=A0A4Y2U9I3_ARAVE|nr:hypothetical protein AVEN_146319-1 [Araneus ventricosus]
MEDKRIKRKMVKTDAAHAQSLELLELNTMSSSLYTDTVVITLEYQSENRLDLPTLARIAAMGHGGTPPAAASDTNAHCGGH